MRIAGMLSAVWSWWWIGCTWLDFGKPVELHSDRDSRGSCRYVSFSKAHSSLRVRI